MSTLKTDVLKDVAETVAVNVIDIPSAISLRTDLANAIDAAKGAALIGYAGGTVVDFLSSGQRTLKSFGVVGDGVTDDSSAMALVAAHSGLVVGSRDMVVLTDDFTVTGALQLNMFGGTIKVKSALQQILINANDVEFRNCVFDAALFNVNVALFRIPAPYTRWTFKACTIKNIAGIAGSTNQYGIYADLDNTVGKIEDCNFDEISNVSTPAPLSAFCGAMLLSSSVVGATDVRVSNNTIKNVYSSNISGDINNSDADGIRVFGPQPTVKSNLHIVGNTTIDVQKSAIKVSGCKGALIRDTIVYNNRSDVSMIAGVRVQACDDSVVSGVVIHGRATRGVLVRSKNITVEGVVFTPIDTARDTVAGGLIALQSDDTDITEFVKVSNFVGRNIGRAIVFDTGGTTVNEVFRFISISNFDISGIGTLGGGTPSVISKANHVTLSHVRLFDPNSSFTNSITFESVQNLRLHHCRFEARREVFTWTPGVSGCSNIEISGCTFFRADAESANNFAMIPLRDVSAGALDRVRVYDCSVSMPSYNTTSAQNAMICNLTNSDIRGVDFFVRVVGANIPPAFVVGVFNNSKIGDIKVSSSGAVTVGAGVGYAVDLQSGSVNNLVSDVHNSISRGIRASAGANTNLLDTAAAKLNAISDSGTGNVSGSSIVLP